jgi:hypothetical protein
MQADLPVTAIPATPEAAAPVPKTAVKLAKPTKAAKGAKAVKATQAAAAPAAKPAPKAVSKVTHKAVAKPAAAEKAIKAEKAVKPAKDAAKPAPKEKLVRDSFTMPQADFALIAQLKTRALGFQRPTKKSELLRAGLHALAAMDSATLLAALHALEPIKTGRPKKSA